MVENKCLELLDKNMYSNNLKRFHNELLEDREKNPLILLAIFAKNKKFLSNSLIYNFLRYNKNNYRISLMNVLFAVFFFSRVFFKNEVLLKINLQKISQFCFWIALITISLFDPRCEDSENPASDGQYCSRVLFLHFFSMFWIFRTLFFEIFDVGLFFIKINFKLSTKFFII